MKVNILDAHDRLLHFKKQSDSISTCCQNIINQKPFGEHPFYIFAHKRTVGMDEKLALWATGAYKTWEDIPEARVIWQPRLTKPKAETNSMLFKAYPNSDNVKIVWIIPDRAQWGNYKKGDITENKTILESIHDYQYNRRRLEAKEDDDLNDDQIDAIYTNISLGATNKKSMDKLYLGQ